MLSCTLVSYFCFFEPNVNRQVTLSILEKYFVDIATWNRPSGGFYICIKLKKAIPLKKIFESCCKNRIEIISYYIL